MFRRHLRHLKGRLLSPFTRNSLRILQGQDPQGTGDKLDLLLLYSEKLQQSNLQISNLCHENTVTNLTVLSYQYRLLYF